jgi:hypothetical protein
LQFINSFLGDVVYDRYEAAKIACRILRAVLLGALLYFVTNGYRYIAEVKQGSKENSPQNSAFDFCGFIAIIDRIA